LMQTRLVLRGGVVVGGRSRLELESPVWKIRRMRRIFCFR